LATLLRSRFSVPYKESGNGSSNGGFSYGDPLSDYLSLHWSRSSPGYVNPWLATRTSPFSLNRPYNTDKTNEKQSVRTVLQNNELYKRRGRKIDNSNSWRSRGRQMYHTLNASHPFDSDYQQCSKNDSTSWKLTPLSMIANGKHAEFTIPTRSERKKYNLMY